MPPTTNPELASNQADRWSGFYLSAVSGYGRGQSRMRDELDSNPFRIKGHVLGGGLGYNVLLNNDFLLGLETDWSHASLFKVAQGNIGQPDGSNWDCNSSPGCKVGTHWLATMRGRIGYTFDDLMIYGTYGLAVAKIHAFVDPPYIDSTAVNKAAIFGIGAEYKINRNLSGKIEALKTDFGWTAPTFSGSARDIRIIRAGINYRL